MSLTILPALDRPQEIAALFGEYTDLLIAGDPTFREYLALQRYDEELLHLGAKYGPPHGRLYLALMDGEVAGCIGLRRIDDARCEMKRLYVRPAFRAQGIGSALCRRVIGDARQIGYQSMLLDTLPFLDTAIRLYRRLGFEDIPCYNDSPMQDAVYLRLTL